MFNLPSFGVGFAVGFGTGFVTREIFQVGRKSLEPIARSAMQTGIKFVERGRESLAHLGETVEDLFAEAQAELRSKQMHNDAVEAKNAAKEPSRAVKVAGATAKPTKSRRKTTKKATTRPTTSQTGAKHDAVPAGVA